jgi:hypothetical protein
MPKTQYVFMAGGDACGACSALAGTVSDAPLGAQHSNCMCASIPLTAGDVCPTYTADNVSTHHTGPGERAEMFFEIEVTCCDGSSIGESYVYDWNPAPGMDAMSDAFDELEADLDQLAQELAEGCPDDDGEGDLVD